MTVHTHSSSGYKNGCRCDVCRAAFREHNRAYRHRKGIHRPRSAWLAELAEIQIPHGTESCYKNRGCRCEACKAASAAARARRRARVA